MRISKDIHKRTHLCSILMPVFIIFFSLLLMNLITMAKPHLFLSDDNIMQWEPIIKKSFDRFFSSGKMPCIDFYQYKKLNTLAVGYYSLNNPLMLLSYTLNRFVFGSRFGSISVYIYLMFAFGNSLMYILLKKIGITTVNSLLSVLSFSAVSMFVFYGFYYFSFNNYFFIPLLFLVILCSFNSISAYFAPGICLAFSLLLGHVQYTFYYYIVYAIIMLIFALRHNARYILIMLTNIIIAAVLSAPELILLLDASANRFQILLSFSGFMKDPIPVINLLFHFAWPLYLVKEAYAYIIANGALRDQMNDLAKNYIYLGALLPLFLLFISGYYRRMMQHISKAETIIRAKYFDKINPRRTRFYSGLILAIFVLNPLAEVLWIFGLYIVWSAIATLLYIGALYLFKLKKGNLRALIVILNIALSPTILFLISVFCIIIEIKEKFPVLKEQYSNKKSLSIQAESNLFQSAAWAGAIASLFFIIFSSGDVGLLARLLSYIPVIKTFRFLYKGAFIFIPLMVIPAAYALNTVSRRKAMVDIAVIALALIGIVNSWFIVNSGFHTYYNNSFYQYNDKADYISQISKRINDLSLDTKNYRFVSILNDGLSSNYIETSSAECYEKMTKNISTLNSTFTLAGYDNSFSSESYIQSNMIFMDAYNNNMYTNAVDGPALFTRLNLEKGNSTAVRKFYSQLNSNSVKYFLFSKDDAKGIREFTKLVDKIPELSILRTVDFIKNTILVEINGVAPLCKTSSCEFVALNSEIDELSFKLIDNKAEYITLAFTYDKYYKAIYTDNNGHMRTLEISGDNENFTKIITDDLSEGTIKLIYDNPLCDLTLICSILISALFLTGLVYLMVRHKTAANDASDSVKRIERLS